ncbi:ParA family protein [Staphylococcus simulans]|uniref:ParA family protein n=1 Tax=Staphylococcus simulans TaxID=1286 RepID=UPI0039897CF0
MYTYIYISLNRSGGINIEIITFTAIKGGVGKNTLSYNFAGYLADSNHKVLMIDLDHQRNSYQILGG